MLNGTGPRRLWPCDAGGGGRREGVLTGSGAGFPEEVMLEFRTRGWEGVDQAKRRREPSRRQGQHAPRPHSGTEPGESGGCSADGEGRGGAVSLEGWSEAWPCGPWCPEGTLLLLLRAVLKSAKGRSHSSASGKGRRAPVPRRLEEGWGGCEHAGHRTREAKREAWPRGERCAGWRGR